MVDESQTLSDRLRIILAQEGLKQNDFSDITGYDSRKVSNIIRKETKIPRVDLIEGIMTHFPHWNLQWLLMGQGEMFVTKGAVSYVGTVDKVLEELTADKTLQKENEHLKREIEQLKNRLSDKEEIIELLKGKLGE